MGPAYSLVNESIGFSQVAQCQIHSIRAHLYQSGYLSLCEFPLRKTKQEPQNPDLGLGVQHIIQQMVELHIIAICPIFRTYVLFIGLGLYKVWAYE